RHLDRRNHSSSLSWSGPMSKHDDDQLAAGTMNRRRLLKCMAWAGTGVVWTLFGGIPRPFGLTETAAAAAGFSFVQISDSHIGFDKPANPDVKGTLQETIAKVNALSARPAFMLHTGDIPHLAKPE